MRFDMYGGHHGSSEELGLFLHVVALPQRQPVKLLDRHSKHVKEQLRSQVALERERERRITYTFSHLADALVQNDVQGREQSSGNWCQEGCCGI